MALKIAKVTDAAWTSTDFVRTATQAFEVGNLEKAVELFLKALQLDDKNGQIFLQLAAVFTKSGKHDKALVAAKCAAELLPYDKDVFNVLGVILFQIGWYPTSELCFRKVLDLDPEHSSARRNLVECRRLVRDGVTVEEPAELASIRELASRQRPTISLCMIVKNEEAFLADCLASVQGAVDEIVIVDTGSTDATLEIAKKYGAKIGYFPWNGDFAAARNASIDLAQGDWILILDADETITPHSVKELRALSLNKNYIGYACIIENLVGEKEGDGRQLAMILRFFQRRPDMHYEGIIHEQIVPAAQRTGLPNGTSQIRIVHRGYINKCVNERNKNQRNLDILLRQEQAEPDNPYCQFNLGQTYKLLKEHQKAEQHYRESLEILKARNAPNDIPYYANLFFSFSDLLGVKGCYDEALAVAEDGIERFPQYADLRFTKGNHLLATGRYEEALKVYESCRKFADQVFV
ncbi:MAG: glycosyltransferase, partial [Cyanobacteria bacterium NC_groundwater_1444_Ag_S-0.65um_54_12]|nr:glycosyltransferase [Cyanobacteria bacterium NC_groundwater_1444_Ag_S-0.65um_54_12]